MTDRFQRILVLKLRQLGDVLLTTPVLRALRENCPGAEITACVYPGTGQILEGNPCINHVLPGRSGDGLGLLGRGMAELRMAKDLHRRRFDLAIDLTTSDRSAILTRLTGAPIRLGYASHKGFLGRSRLYTHHVHPSKQLEHIVLKHLRILEPLGIRSTEPKLEFPVSEADRQFVRPHLPGQGRLLQVHPVSRIARKNWPAEFLAEVVNVLAGAGWKIVITGSNDPAEKAWIHGFAGRLSCPAVDLSGRLNLRQLGAVSSLAHCFLGVDTAPMHIAAAVGTPVIALFGPSTEQLWAPWGTRKLVLSRDLSCRAPCKDKHCQTIHCLREFTPAMVLPRIVDFLQDTKMS